MDLIIYILVLIAVGFLKVKNVTTATPDVLVTAPCEAVQETASLPIGRNLSLDKETDAYTLIIEELGLK